MATNQGREADEPISGGCHCGDLRYAIHAELGAVANCHCGFCRRIHGAPYTTVAFVPARSFHWTAGEARIFTTPQGSRRHFCARCGTPVVNLPAMGEHASLVMGSLDPAFQRQAWFHVNVESRLPWIDVGDGLPAFEGFPSRATIREIARERRRGTPASRSEDD